MDYPSGNGDRIDGPDPVSTRIKSRKSFKLQDFPRLAQNGTGYALGFRIMLSGRLRAMCTCFYQQKEDDFCFENTY